MASETKNLPALIEPSDVEKILLGAEIELPEGEDPEIAFRQIVARILSAENPDELLTVTTTTPSADLLDVPIRVVAVHFNRSAFEEGPALYAVAEVVVIETGEKQTVTCGGRNVMTQWLVAEQKGWLPLDGMLWQVPTQTARGFKPLWFRALDGTEPESAKSK